MEGARGCEFVGGQSRSAGCEAMIGDPKGKHVKGKNGQLANGGRYKRKCRGSSWCGIRVGECRGDEERSGTLKKDLKMISFGFARK